MSSELPEFPATMFGVQYPFSDYFGDLPQFPAIMFGEQYPFSVYIEGTRPGR